MVKLEKKIREELNKSPIALMTHLVMGYPSFNDNIKCIEAMAKSGVKFIELQIPFSEPTADGPKIAKASQISIENGTTVKQCHEFASQMVNLYPEVSFLFMNYANTIFRYGITKFIKESAEIGVLGHIIPDLPIEESEEYIDASQNADLATIFIYTPTTTSNRLIQNGEHSTGFVYCVGRAGVTGGKTDFNSGINELLLRYRSSTNLPIALGFGITSKSDIDFLIGKSDIAIIGTKLLEVYDAEGAQSVTEFLSSLIL